MSRVFLKFILSRLRNSVYLLNLKPVISRFLKELKSWPHHYSIFFVTYIIIFLLHLYLGLPGVIFS